MSADRNRELDDSIGDGIGELLARLGAEELSCSADLTDAQLAALAIPADPFAGLPGQA